MTLTPNRKCKSVRHRLRRLPLFLIASLAFGHVVAHAQTSISTEEAVDRPVSAASAVPSEGVDERYRLAPKTTVEANRFALKDQANAVTELTGSTLGVKPSGRSGEPGFVLPKRFANLDTSKGYKAVQKHLKAAAKAHAVDYDLLKAVIAAESGFDAEAVSPKGAVGLMQLMPTTAAQYGVVADTQARKDRKGQILPARTVEEKLTDPQTNIQAGARYLAYLIKLFKGELSLAVAAYNAGEGAVQRAGNKVPNYKETQGYVKTVMALYQQFKPEPASVLPYPVANAVGRVGSQVASGSGRLRVELGGLTSWTTKPVMSTSEAP